MRVLPVAAKNPSPAHMFELTADKFPDKPAIIFEDRSLTYRQMDDAANQMVAIPPTFFLLYFIICDEFSFFFSTFFSLLSFFLSLQAHFFLGTGLKKGDIVALDMDNRPEFLITWLGVAKAGGASALINHNLKDKSLIHCAKVSDAKFFVFGIELADKVADVAGDLKQAGMRLFCQGGTVGFAESLDKPLQQYPRTRPPKAGVSPLDCWAFIYTSGTTGLPKAALIRNSKFWGSSSFFATQFGLTDKDVVYNCLPLYHSAGGMICVGMSFLSGATMVLKRKFSATAFWEDVRKYKVTAFQVRPNQITFRFYFLLDLLVCLTVCWWVLY